MNNALHVVILAAGQGTRMKSDLPKVLHRVGGKTLLEHAVSTAQRLKAQSIHVVYGHGGELVKQNLRDLEVNWVLQEEQLGTGHAVLQAMPGIPSNQTVLVTYGDVPLISHNTLRNLVSHCSDNTLALLTAELLDPTGYGRIIRDADGNVQEIVEEKDASKEQKHLREINTGMMAVNSDLLKRWLNTLNTNNAQGEYYLTDIIAKAVKEGVRIRTSAPIELVEIEGINTKAQLAAIERVYQQQQAEVLMTLGVCFRDPQRFDLRGELVVGKDVEIDINVIIEGKVELGDRVKIGPNNVISNTTIGADTLIRPNCVIESCDIGPHCEIGPFARLRPEVKLIEHVKVGNFVEVKKSTIDHGSKINHLSYIGDTLMGKRVNVGAGTITCNYDGAYKHQTIIEDDVFIGSDTQLVAPVTIGASATIGAGSTITHDAPANELSLSRSEQKSRKGWKRPKKKK